MTEYIVLKLSNDEEVIGKLKTWVKNEYYVLDDVLIVRTIFDNTGTPVIRLSKYCVFSEDWSVRFPQNMIYHCFKPHKHFIRYYEISLESAKKSIDEMLSEEVEKAIEEDDEVINTGKGKLSKSEAISILKGTNYKTTH